MCGINGYVKGNSVTIGQMNDSLKHRGPDTSGTFNDEHLSLGHTLLSIRGNVEESKQPYSKAGSPWVLVFNGQLYNTKQIIDDIGFTYANVDLDTALLYAMVEKHGWDFIDKIHGMFAIALYNKNEQLLKLYRDPSGQKNLYYYRKNDHFIFSSELKSILLHDIDKKVDTDAVEVSTSIGWLPGNKTLFHFIKKLHLSEEVTLDTCSNEFFTKRFKSNSDSYYEGVDDPFAHLISEHMQSKQKVALNLSGGLDSSLILHEMKGQDNLIHTYTNFFENGEERYNTDALLARKLSKDYATDHHEILITKKDFIANFVDAYSIIEEPNYNISNPTYFITAQHEGINGDNNRVILSGDGGDELFGGYPQYLKSKKFDSQIRLLTPFGFNFLKNRNNQHKLSYHKIEDRWFHFRDMYTKHLLQAGFDIPNYLKETADPFLEQYSTRKGITHDMMMYDRIMWQGSENFIRTDKLYMNQSLEMRAPLSYHPFREHFDKALLKNEYLDQARNKIYLRRWYEGKLPDYITKRESKTGWRAPVQIWYDKDFKDLFLSIISDVEHQNNIIDWKAVKKSIEKKDVWPGKHIHLYLSLAILSKKFGIEL